MNYLTLRSLIQGVAGAQGVRKPMDMVKKYKVL